MGGFVSSIAGKLNLISGLAVLLMMAFMTIDVVFRYFFNSAFLDQIEISSLLLGAINSLALPFVTDKEEHITFDMVIERFSIGSRRITRVITLTISMAIFALLTWQATIRGVKSFKEGEFGGTLELPLWPIKLLFALACLLSLLIFMTQFIACFTRKGMLKEETLETI
jgi:TRAP-type C4-dicarboxylate transport system permease small subunit